MQPRRFLIPALAAALLGACGGGVYLSYEFGDDDEFGPDVSLSSSVTAAEPGASVQLSAAASDGDGVDEVAFFRDDPGDWVLLARDPGAPFRISTVVPDDGRTVVRYFARATDNRGERGDSNIVTIDVIR